MARAMVFLVLSLNSIVYTIFHNLLKREVVISENIQKVDIMSM
jgi:hypothetical protein